ncbi:MAG: Uma2 family endonuclease [Saprospiraceae bacterium]|nr:Uma2 family endonuclease [Saprospiraceae bacterium]
MATSIPLRAPREQSFFKVTDFEKKLEGREFALLDKNVLLYRDKAGEYVLLTIKSKHTYTADDYMQLPEGAPYELLNGKLTYMPSPKDPHQDAVGNLFAALLYFVKANKLGIVRVAPLDVHLDKENIVQPDILFLSNTRLDRRKDFIYGAPDLMVEVLSTGTKKKDQKTKLTLYEKHGVLEYWLVDTDKRTIEVQVAKDGKFTKKALLHAGDTLVAEVVPGFEVGVGEVFG